MLFPLRHVFCLRKNIQTQPARPTMRALLLTFLLLLSNALCATDVSGVISANTTWTLAGSPYVMTGDIEVRALLIVEPGVQIKVAALKGMKVYPEGRLVAGGTSALPIVMTSIRDVAAGTPMAGDWGYLHIIGNPSNALPSELRFFRMRFGKALKLESASPLLRQCVFEGQLEAAIVMDLKSSPTGADLTATGNGINGIVVPAGVLDGQARWSIRSLPYVVRGGLLHVGEKPPALQFVHDNLALAPKATGTLQLRLADPAPSTITVTLSSSAATVATVPLTTSIAQDQYTVDVPVSAFAPGTALITATAPGMNSPVATLTVAPLPSIFLNPANATVGLNRSTTLSLSLNSPAPVGGLEVLLNALPTGRINAPSGLLIATSSGGNFFNVSGLSIGSTVMNASAQGYVSASLPIEVVPLSMAFSDPVLVPIGTRNTNLQLSHPALAGGGIITLSSSNPAVLSVPATATFPGLGNSARIPMQGLTEGTATVTANSAEYGQTSTLVRVEKLAANFDTAATRIPIGMIESYAIRLNGAAPNEGLSFALTSSDPAIASVTPAVITIVPGQYLSTVKARITVHGVGPVTITANNSTTQPAILAVDALARGQFVFSAPSLLLGNVSQSHQVRVSIFAGGGLYYPQTPLAVQFSVSDPTKLTAELYSDGLRANDPVLLSGLANTTSAVSVQAIFPEVLPAAMPLLVTVLDPVVAFNDLDGIRGLASGRDDFYLTWRVPGSSDIMQTPSANQTLALSVVDAAPAGIVDGFYEAANGSTLGNTVSFSTATNRSSTRYVGAPTALGDYKVRATSASFGAFTSATQSVQGFNLHFTRASATLGKGMRTGFGAIAVERRVGATAQTLSTPLTVTLQNSDPSRVGAPSSVTIPAFTSAAAIDLTGLELTQAVTLSATAPAYESGAALNLKVVDPTVQIRTFYPTVFTDAGRTLIFFDLIVPPGSDVVSQFPAPSLSLGVSVLDLNPADIVSGIYAAPTGGAPVNSIGVNFQTGEIQAYLGEPISAGSLRVRASLAGNPGSPWTSNLIQVLVNQVQLEEPSYSVMKGLKQLVRVRTLGPVGPNVMAGLSCAQTSICSVTPPSLSVYGGSEFNLLGVALGSTTVTLQSTPATYGTQTRPVNVVPGAMTFVDNGPSHFRSSNAPVLNRGGTPSGWTVGFLSPNVAPQNLDISIELVDQNPPGSANLESTPLALTMLENNSEAPYQGGYSGFSVNYAAIGTYKFRATVPGVGVFTSPVQSTMKFQGSDCGGAVGQGYKVAVQLNTTLAANTPLPIMAACTPANACAQEGTMTLLPGESTARGYILGGVPQEGSIALRFNSPVLGMTQCGIYVLPPTFYASPSLSTMRIGASNQGRIQIYASGYGGQEAVSPMSFQLSSSNPAVITVPNTVTMAVNTGVVEFPITALTVGTATVTATFPGIGSESFQVTVTQ